jgi:serum/glucocorticoid-regulated kinase 2
MSGWPAPRVQVFQVRKKDTKEIFAMKVLKKEVLVKRKQVGHTQTERLIMETVDHPFMVNLRFAFQTRSKLYMVMDYFCGGELFFHLRSGRFNESRARLYAAEMVLALDFLHTRGIIYRDLKPENVLLDSDGHIKITDFGLSKQSAGLTQTFCGTPAYLAPEVIRGGQYDCAVDWWSLGTLLYEMLCGMPPFYSTNLNSMYKKILFSPLRLPSFLSAPAASVLTMLLTREPRNRLGSGGGGHVRNHPFFAQVDWERLYHKEVDVEFKPRVLDGKMDTTNIDFEFKQERLQDTPDDQPSLPDPRALASSVAANAVTGMNFSHFTYVKPSSAMPYLQPHRGDFQQPSKQSGWTAAQ